MNTIARSSRLLAGLVLACAIGACSSSDGTANGTAVGVNGGTVVSADGIATLTIPPGALDRTVNIAIDPYQPQPGDPPAIPGTAYYFNPTGTQFALPLTLTVNYDPAQLPPGADETQLRIYKLHPDGTQDFAAGSVDLNARTVTGEIRSFSPRLVAPCPQCLDINLAGAMYNANRTVDLSWFTAISGSGFNRIERAKVVGRLTVFESDFVPLADVLVQPNAAPAYTDTTLDAAIYYYRVRWSFNNGRILAQPSNVQQVTVFGQVGPPQASFTFSPAAPAVGGVVAFDASGSTDDGTIDSYFWDFEGDGAYDTTGPMPQFSYASAGVYTVRLRVVDDTGLASETTRTVGVGQGPFTLTVIVDGNGEAFSRDGDEGTGQPPSLFCLGDNDPNTPPVQCQASYARNTTVTLTPISFNPNLPPGAFHASWQGCLRITANGDCEVLMDGSKSVTATIQ